MAMSGVLDAACDDHHLPAGRIAISVEAKKTGSHGSPLAPRRSAGASPRPSTVSQAATTGRVAGDVDDLRDQSESADRVAVATRLTALGDEDVSAAVAARRA